MSRGKRAPATGADVGQEARTPLRRGVAAFLRQLAQRAEDDPDFAASLGELMRASGLLPAGTPPTDAAAPTHGGHAPAIQPLDPYVVLRVDGADGLRAALASLELADLRAIVRRHRFDPARLSARWTAKDRLIALIVDQTQARADHGKAFARL